MKQDEAYYFLKNRGYSSLKKLSMFEVRNLLNDFLIEQRRIESNKENGQTIKSEIEKLKSKIKKMKYLIIIFLFSCTTIPENTLFSISEKEKSSYVVFNQPDFPDDYHQIEYIGNWTHMSNGGSYSRNENDTARFGFWGYGVQIRTELSGGHEAYQVIIDGEFVESINVKNPINTAHNLTYSNMELNTGNHTLELVPDGGYFVLNTLTIHQYVDPTPDEDCLTDTVYLPSECIPDTIKIYYQPKIFIKADSLYFEIK